MNYGFQYFIYTILATISGILYWMTVENLSYLKSKFVLSAGLSVILTPFIAWGVSVIIKAMHLKSESHPARA